MIKLPHLAFAVLAPLCLSLPAHAMTASQKVEVERKITQADGTVQTVMSKAEKVLPGDVMVYTVSYFNDKQEITENFRLDMPVPNAITYVEGSADRDNANILYSVDGGATYLARNSLRVQLPAGGSRSAAPSDITHIRWTLSAAIAPGESGEIQFKGQLK